MWSPPQDERMQWVLTSYSTFSAFLTLLTWRGRRQLSWRWTSPYSGSGQLPNRKFTRADRCLGVQVAITRTLLHEARDLDWPTTRALPAAQNKKELNARLTRYSLMSSLLWNLVHPISCSRRRWRWEKGHQCLSPDLDKVFKTSTGLHLFFWGIESIGWLPRRTLDDFNTCGMCHGPGWALLGNMYLEREIERESLGEVL